MSLWLAGKLATQPAACDVAPGVAERQEEARARDTGSENTCESECRSQRGSQSGDGCSRENGTSQSGGHQMVVTRHQGLQWMDESDWRKDRIMKPSPKRQKTTSPKTLRVGYKGAMNHPSYCRC